MLVFTLQYLQNLIRIFFFLCLEFIFQLKSNGREFNYGRANHILTLYALCLLTILFTERNVNSSLNRWLTY